MIQTTLSPAELSYLPFIYTIWADGLLTASELDVIRNVIEKDPVLSAGERNHLSRWLVPEKSPDEVVFEQWKTILNAPGLSVDLEEKYPLTDFAIRLARSEDPDFGGYQEGLQHIEYNLGLQPVQYRHLFDEFPEEIKDQPSFSESQFRKILEGSYSDLIQELQQKLATDPLYHWEKISDIDLLRDKTSAQVGDLGASGYGAKAFPKEYGGVDDLGAYGHIFENLIYAGGSTAVKFGVQYGLFGGSVASLGTEKHHQKWLRKIGTGEIPGCFAMTEESHGSNVKSLQTTATYIHDQDCFEIHTPRPEDGKIFIGGATTAKMATVFAQLIVNGKNEGVHALVVPLRDADGNTLPGIRIEDNGHKGGLNGVDNGRIWFDQIKVPRTHLLDRFGSVDETGQYQSPISSASRRFFMMLGTLVGGRICVGKGTVAASKLGLKIALKYAYQRRQFGQDVHLQENLLIDYPSHQMRLFPLLAKTYALHFALEDLMKRFARVPVDADKRELETEAAALKSMATWHGNQTLQECREACGGQGYMSENRLPELKDDIDIFSTFEGDNYVILQLTAKGVLSEFQTDFSADTFFGVIKYLRRQVADRLVNFNPVYTNNVDVSHLYSRSFHKDAFSYRRRRLTFSVAQRMNRLFKTRITPYQAFLRVQTHMIQLAMAYAEERCLLAFHKIIEETTSHNEQFMLKRLSALYALSTIYENNGWYLEQGYISGNKSKAIRQLLHRHVAQMVPDGPALVRAFGIPERYLDLPFLQSNTEIKPQDQK